MKKYLVSLKLNEAIEYEAENEREAIENMKDWIEKEIYRMDFQAKEV